MHLEEARSFASVVHGGERIKQKTKIEPCSLATDARPCLFPALFIP